MLKVEELFSALTPEDLQRVETAAKAANKEPRDWLKERVLEATSLVEKQRHVAEENATVRSAEAMARPRTCLNVEHIERDEGIVRLHVRLILGEVRLTQGCTFGGARLRMNTEDIRLLTNPADSRQVIFVLANPHDASRFEKGKAYEFREAQG